MKLEIKGKISSSADATWEVLGSQFAEIANWFSIVKFSKPVNKEDIPSSYKLDSRAPVAGRYTESAVVKATEVLTYYSDSERTFVFEAIDVPKFMLSSTTNRTSVTPIAENDCEVQIQVDLRFKHVFKILVAPIMKKRMTKMFNTLIFELDLKLSKKTPHNEIIHKTVS